MVFSSRQHDFFSAVAVEEATAYVMSAITKLLEEIRGEKAPSEVFDPKKSALPRTGNYKKDVK